MAGCPPVFERLLNIGLSDRVT